MNKIFFFFFAALAFYSIGLQAQTIPQPETVPPNYPPISFIGDESLLPQPTPLQNCSQSSPDFAYYNNIGNYIPDANTPVKNIEIAFNIFQKSDGTGNFQNTGTDKQALLDLLSWVNWNYNNGDAPSDPITGVVEIPKRYIQFSLGPVGQERIYFYQDDNLNKADCFNVSGYNVGDLQNATWGSGPQADPTRRNYLNIYLTEGNAQNGSSGCASMPIYSDTPDMYHVIYSAYSAYSIYGLSGLWVTNIIMRHEIAHNLGLCHTYLGGGCSANCNTNDPNFWSDVFGNPSNCPHNADFGTDAFDPMLPTPATHGLVTNNILGGNKAQGYASAKQIGEMHRALSLKTIRKYVSPCTYTPLQPIVIPNNQYQLWDFDIRLYSDLIVQSGTTLDVACKITMPCNSTIQVKSGATLKVESGAVIALNQDAKIIIERGGLLLIDGGKLTNGTANTLWQGIELWGTRTSNQTAPGAQGKVILKNGAVIENAMEGITTIKTDINGDAEWDFTGGIIRANNSAFRNCRRAVQFLSYTFPNTSYFSNCTFETTGLLADLTVKPYSFVSLYDVKGVKFSGNTFRNIAPAAFAAQDRGSGINSIDAGYGLYELYISQKFFQPNKFENLFYGIHASNSKTLNTVTISKTEFISNSQGIFLSNIKNATIIGNKFDVANANDPFTPEPYGLYLNLCYGYHVEDNDFFSSQNRFSIGAIANNAGVTKNQYLYAYENTLLLSI